MEQTEIITEIIAEIEEDTKKPKPYGDIPKFITIFESK